MKRIVAFNFILVLALAMPNLPVSADSAAQVSPKDAPDQAYISGVVGHAQSLSLSCESRSAADWAAFWGVNASELEILNRLPRSDNPNDGFVGNPNDDWGYTPPYSYGVHADPIARGLRALGLDAHAGTGLSWEEIRAEVGAGRPVIVWVIGQIYSGDSKTYKSEDGQNVRVAAFEHTMILIGYDQKTVHLVDAFTGLTVSHSLENFLDSWSVLGNMAVIGRGSQDQEVESDNLQKESEHIYTVQNGDTLAKIATAWDISWQSLAAENQIGYPYYLALGQELVIPTRENELQIEDEGTGEVAPPITSSSETYVVQSGEHLMSIARDLDIEWQELAAVNNLNAPYLLFPGEELQLPGVQPEGESNPKDAPPPSIILEANESLYSLAHRFDLSWIDLAALNHLGFPYMLRAGQEILLTQ